MNTIKIDGVHHIIDEVQGGMFGFSSVFVDGYAACHQVPDEIINRKIKGKVKTGGHTYE